MAFATRTQATPEEVKQESQPVPASSTEGWTKKEFGGNFFKFEQVGESLEGVFRGTWPDTYNGKPVTNGKVELADGKTANISIGAGLTGLKDIAVGTQVKIVYLGKQKSSKGNFFKAFDIFTK